MIKVFQIPSNKLDEIYPQSPFMYGKGENKFFDLMANIKHYEHVANLDVETLDEAFEVGNIGPEEKYTRFARMHSVSVGDILVTDSGSTYVVASFGFDPIGIKITERVA
tara:strand:- start:128 stop:454 length:327 start_codon:yes stop_codon:yes gene_type:complete